MYTNDLPAHPLDPINIPQSIVANSRGPHICASSAPSVITAVLIELCLPVVPWARTGDETRRTGERETKAPSSSSVRMTLLLQEQNLFPDPSISSSMPIDHEVNKGFGHKTHFVTEAGLRRPPECERPSDKLAWIEGNGYLHAVQRRRLAAFQIRRPFLSLDMVVVKSCGHPERRKCYCVLLVNYRALSNHWPTRIAAETVWSVK